MEKPGPQRNKTYRDVKSAILGRITEGKWPPGALIPGEVELAQAFGCSRATVNRAMRELSDEGLLDRFEHSKDCAYHPPPARVSGGISHRQRLSFARCLRARHVGGI